MIFRHQLIHCTTMAMLLIAGHFSASSALAADNALQKGEKLASGRDYPGALLSLNKSIKINPGDSSGYAVRGFVFLKLKQLQLAIIDCNKALSLNSRNSMALSNRGEAYFELNDYSRAVADCSKAITLDPRAVAPLITRARAYANLGLLDKAMNDFDLARSLIANEKPVLRMQIAKGSEETDRTKEKHKSSHSDGLNNIDGFGGIDRGYIIHGPAGMKTVGFGHQFYVLDESNEKLFSRGQTGTAAEAIGWRKWRLNLAKVLAYSWPGELPGQAQVLVTITKEGDVSLKWLAYIAGADIHNKCTTSAVNPQAQQLYINSITETLLHLQKSAAIKFPTGSSASKVVALAHFVADHDLIIALDDLSLLQGIPENERDLRIARICSILDTEELFQLSDHFRKNLPPSLQHHFIRPNGRRFITSTWPGFWAIPGREPGVKDISLPPESTVFVTRYIDNCLETRQFVKGEIAARYLAWAVHSDRVFQVGIEKSMERGDLNDAEMWRKKKLTTVEQLTSRFASIDDDMKEPMGEFREATPYEM